MYDSNAPIDTENAEELKNILTNLNQYIQDCKNEATDQFETRLTNIQSTLAQRIGQLMSSMGINAGEAGLLAQIQVENEITTAIHTYRQALLEIQQKHHAIRDFFMSQYKKE